MQKDTAPDGANFIKNIIAADVAAGKTRVATRFPPEPNGYLHLGHVKSICLNFGMKQDFQGSCNLRFDDTNPEKENEEYMASIKNDVHWLGFEWDELRHASDYFPQLLDYAYQLIDRGLAYVDSQSGEEIRQQRGTLTEPGQESPYRNRSVAENRQLFDEMVAGQHPDGSHVLRAKIDMASPNINLRDPVIYRIRHAAHFHAGDSWKVYPMYDYTHCLSDMLEGITHSLCTLEFEDHRPLYDWVLDVLNTPCHPRQIEFARLALEYTVLSKRRLIQLVQEGHVQGWDDPRMPTIAGLRRRGVPAGALREFCRKIGISKADGTIAIEYFESVIRDYLNEHAPRRMAVLRPLKLTITNLADDFRQTLTVANHPQREELGTRQLSFSNQLFIEREDFAEVPPPKWKRFSLGGAIRLRGAYVLRCDEVVKDAAGEIVELRCSYDPDTLGQNPVGYKASGVIHWVDGRNCQPAEIRSYDRLFLEKNPMAAENFLDTINPQSLQIISGARVEATPFGEPFTSYKFARLGYYAFDADSSAERLVFNRTITLKEGN